MNLLSNAIDAIEGSGCIHITSGQQGNDFVIEIVDTGSGIAEAVRERVFDPFFTTKPVGQGTGLGLSITYAIVRRHRGSLALLPVESGGTRAKLTLPLAI
jgi:two-component system NtrC family sensor kinase